MQCPKKHVFETLCGATSVLVNLSNFGKLLIYSGSGLPILTADITFDRYSGAQKALIFRFPNFRKKGALHWKNSKIGWKNSGFLSVASEPHYLEAQK